jgi:hypothetical protein
VGFSANFDERIFFSLFRKKNVRFALFLLLTVGSMVRKTFFQSSRR